MSGPWPKNRAIYNKKLGADAIYLLFSFFAMLQMGYSHFCETDL